MNPDLWQKFLKGDETAFEQLYLVFFGELFAYGLKIGFNEETCKDAIQDVFYKVYTSRHNLKHIKNIEFYLLKTLKNQLLDYYDKESKLSRIDFHELVLKDENCIIEEMIENETKTQLAGKIKQSLKNLPPKQRKIIYYHYQLDLTYQEIAVLLQMETGSVRKAANRALQKLKNSGNNFKLYCFILPIC